MQTDTKASNVVALFATCLVDQVYPEIGIAVTRIIKRLGYKVDFPADQTCCGQPFYNSGFVKEARRLAKRTIDIFLGYPTIVLPSGSCTTMIRNEYPHLFSNDETWLKRANVLAAKTFEFTEFVMKKTNLEIRSPVEGQLVTYHDSCHMCRTLGIKDEPRTLLKQAGYQITEMEQSDRCCGFGGLFSARVPEVSQAMTEEKISRAIKTGAQILVSSDPGCIMQMRNHLRDGSSIKVKHIAELLDEVTR
ncbi:MAG: (Fe-S)-binding protein [Anaerolineales bacterium]|jgi:L-lactate dehydrogenase complex protein LldE